MYNVGSGDFINHAFTVHLVAVTLYSFSLVRSKASERRLLKKAGYLSVIALLIILPIHLIGLNLPEGATLDMLITINMLVGRLSSFIIIFYILNFYQELRSQGNVVLQT